MVFRHFPAVYSSPSCPPHCAYLQLTFATSSCALIHCAHNHPSHYFLLFFFLLSNRCFLFFFFLFFSNPPSLPFTLLAVTRNSISGGVTLFGTPPFFWLHIGSSSLRAGG